VKKDVAKKEKKMTATQTVLAIIKESRKGLDTAGLKEKICDYLDFPRIFNIKHSKIT